VKVITGLDCASRMIPSRSDPAQKGPIGAVTLNKPRSSSPE